MNNSFHRLYASAITSEDLDQILTLLERVKNELGIPFEVVYELPPEKSILDLVEEFRIVSRKRKVRVRSRGGGPLPISRSGKANLSKIPVLLVLDGEAPVQVYPHEGGPKGQRFEIHDYLKDLFEGKISPDALKEGETPLSENDISRILWNFPSLLEKGLKRVETEVELPSGARVDLVFKDSNNKLLLVEIELKAGDAAIGQVLRFAAGAKEKYGSDADRLRKVMVCIDISESCVAACREGSIEVWKLNLDRIDEDQ